MKKTTLEQLTFGRSARILSLGNKNSAVRRRLLSMGLTPGAPVTAVRASPLGDPVAVRVRGSLLSLRRADAGAVYVSEEKESPAPLCGGCRADCRRCCGAPRSRPERAVPERARIALTGNPNCGKTTLFNALTGSDQYVGNWPGVTVEKKSGRARHSRGWAQIVDLPGIYALSPWSQEENVARGYLTAERPDAVINVVDATNLERNLPLTIELLELGVPVVVALNFMDEVRRRGASVDAGGLAEALGVSVVPISAKNGEGLTRLLEAAVSAAASGAASGPDGLYDESLCALRRRVQALIAPAALQAGLPADWTALKLLEGDADIRTSLALSDADADVLARLLRELPDGQERLADCRFRYAAALCARCLQRPPDADAPSVSERLDRVLTHRIFALPIFLAAMLLVFFLTFGPPGAWLSESAGIVIGDYLRVYLERLLAFVGAPAWLTSLLSGGILTGVGSVLSFLPGLTLLFACLSVLEDSGYMARAAFLMDRLFARFGLSGKAFIPMLLGFGCTVPAVLGARTMGNDRERRMTILLLPFVSCSAKLPVYGLLCGAFFGKYAAFVVFGLYVLGLAGAAVSGLLFDRTLFRGGEAPFVLELPPYRMPGLGNVLRHVWMRVRAFLLKAGGLILAMSAVLWFLQHFDLHMQMTQNASESILAALGGAIAPVLRPLGFGVWQAAVALLAGLAAKESVAASLAMFCGFSLSAGGGEVCAALGSVFPTCASALSFLVFTLLYTPCCAAMSTIYRELGSRRLAIFSALWQLAAAYAAAFVVFTLASLFV